MEDQAWRQLICLLLQPCPCDQTAHLWSSSGQYLTDFKSVPTLIADRSLECSSWPSNYGYKTN